MENGDLLNEKCIATSTIHAFKIGPNAFAHQRSTALVHFDCLRTCIASGKRHSEFLIYYIVFVCH